MGIQKKVGRKLFAVAWKHGKKGILISKKSLDIGKVIGLWAKSFKRNCDLSWERFRVLQNLFSMDWKRRLKNSWSVQEYLEPHFKIKCLSSCLSGSNWIEGKQALFKEFYKIGWMAFQILFPLIAGRNFPLEKRSQIGMIALSFLRIQPVLGKVTWRNLQMDSWGDMACQNKWTLPSRIKKIYLL